MIKRILIANRGEIAVRILRACREMAISSIALFTPIDKNGLWVSMADEAYEIESYLNLEAIIKIAKEIKADAIHPGYGFLSERSNFPQRCQEEKIIFIGPSSDAIRHAGDKIEARRIAIREKIPVLPGTSPLSTFQEAEKESKSLDYPFLIKAAAGGGGRGMRIIRSFEELKQNFESASREAASSFGDGRLYLEKYLEEPRHIEIQVLADSHGNAVYFPERECSIQRRYQKLIEESPSPFVNDSLRQALGKSALTLVKATGYTNAGTVEFIVDQTGRFYFLEMNARLQVEHPVTEMVTGLDLVKAQIKIASGEKLAWKQEEIKSRGWAFEARINGEDPYRDFLPSPGKITALQFPEGPGVRIDSALYAGYTVPETYDSLIAKIIVHAENRGDAILRMHRALTELHIGGLPTTTPFLLNIFHHAEFQKGNLSTHFLNQHLPELLPPFTEEEVAIAEVIATLEQIRTFVSLPQNRWAVAGRLNNIKEVHEAHHKN